MTRVRFQAGMHLWLHKHEYIIQERTGNKFKLLEESTGQINYLSEKELVKYFFTGELTFQKTAEPEAFNHYQAVDFSEIPESLKAEAQRKEKYVLTVLEEGLSTYTSSSLTPIIEKVAQNIEDKHPPSHITLYRWLKDYLPSGGDIRSLIPRHQGKGNFKPKITAEVYQIIKEVITEVYLTPERPSIASIYDVVICRIIAENNLRKSQRQAALKIPHRTTIYRQIQQLDPIEKAVGRYGKRTASLMYDPVKEGPRPSRPLEKVEIDHTLLPFFVVDTDTRMPIGTPSLTSAVDKYSGVIVGYYLSFEPFSSLSVMQCLLHAIHPKDYVKNKFPSVKKDWNVYGLMEIVVVDNGKEFYSKHFQDACQQLGISIQYTPPYMPWYKSSVERTFSSYNTQLLQGQPGTLFKEFITQYDYDPKKNAVVSLEALQEMIHIFIVDIHNQSSHAHFCTPRAEIWSKGIAEHPPTLPPSLQELRVLVGAVEKRVISRRGVELYGLYYHSSELTRLRSNYEREDMRRRGGLRPREKATIKYDPTDLSKIYVLDPTSHQFIVVPAMNQEYTQGLTLWQHKVIKNLAAIEAKRVDIVALALAKQKIQEIVEREWQKSYKGKTRKSMARWLGIGRDDLKVDECTYDNEDLSSQYQESSITTDRELASLFNDSREMTGISDLGDPDNPLLNLLDNQNLELHEHKKELPNDLENKKIKKPKTKKAKTSVTIQEIPEVCPPEPSVIQANEWKPDLTGWEVSIGLPK
ncbi:Mu transposase C-terminal domain-containing protein [Nodularia spumigena]|uniref:Mu transposase C-terminal domain-containing protein n=1 Tax=Nodularia spumigena TaxID=70799 RepID=UPI00232B6666|nr:DDE-type integrase/transposase/recombinase [Nodularia spumigena]MDB9323931.1 DDE-type integrase/transposase/recombinase [Nodularia spumigena CS-591/07A]MDB9329297.1 DDE-type integrase/transposase/recombinase [Nodularia spumigena CS-591/04]MDB9336520.1 DDE-type integrase/transposase/recombinase [Nodularia spumigena CS-590/01]MDB9361690.1 DDE-type integrase/transposase/recombinase [Nodularia spumigena CS-588/02]MDB9364658.1 DDE-type integrase/transposase/recombinase [Nodularia spumigena CS-58